MDAFSPLTSSSNSTSAGASKFLSGLPSSGLFSSTVVASNLGGLRAYVCDHDTSPPEDQLIKTNQTNILIRSLMLKNRSKDAKGTSSSEASRKRPAERPADIRNSAKKPVTTTQVGSQHAVKSGVRERNIRSLTVERLRALLKEKGLSLKGKKDELIARLQGESSQS